MAINKKILMLVVGIVLILNFTLFVSGEAWDISTAVDNGKNFTLAFAVPYGITFNHSGHSMYVIGRTTDKIYQYTLSTAWDVTTAVASGSYSTLAGSSMSGIDFGNNGLVMILADDSAVAMRKYNLGIAWNVSTAVLDAGDVCSGAGKETTAGAELSADGTKMYSWHSGFLHRFSLSPAYDISTCTLDGTKSVGADLTGISFKQDGTRYYQVDRTARKITSWTLPNAWNISTMYNDNFSITPADTTPAGVYISDNGEHIYVTGYTLDKVVQYDMPSTADAIIPNVTINTPLNQTYTTQTISFNVTAVDETGMSNCSYTLNNGLTNYSMTNSSTSPTYWTATNSTMSQGSHTAIFYCNDTSNNLNNSESVTFFFKDTLAPIINLTNPTNNSHINNLTNFTAQITEASLVNVTLYIYNSSNDLYYSEFKAFNGDDIGIEYDLAVEDTYTWYYNATDMYNQQTQGGAFTIIYDITHPLLTWYIPTTPITVTSTPYSINVSAYDPYLDATNVSVYNEGGTIIYTNFSGNLTISTFWMHDPITLQEGLNTLEICARDNLESSPIIFDTANFTKKNAEETEYIMPDGNVVVRELVIKDEFNNKLDAVAINLVTTEEWVEGGRHYKTTWEFDDIGNGFMEILMYDDNGDLELKTDRGVTRVIDRNRNYYWSYGDMESAGFELEYTVTGTGQIEIKATKGTYDNAGGRWVVDPIVAGLNTICENQTIRLDTTAPSTESGGSGSGSTSPSDNSYTNQSSQNFTVNASDVSGVDNVTFFLKNESGDIVYNETVDTGGVLEVFFGFIYNFIIEGVYTWFFTVADAVGNAIDSVISTITYDITNPNISITAPIVNVSTDTLPANIIFNYTINETNIGACYYRIDSGSDLFLNCSETIASVPVSSDGFHNATIIGIDLANNSETDTRPFYLFYHHYNQTTVSPITTEGSIVTFDITVNETDYFDTVAYLVYDGIEYRADSYNIVGDTISFTKELIIPDGSGNSTGKSIFWNWKYQIEGNSYWETNYSTANSTQTVYSVEMDDCSTYSDIILHWDLNDEETDTTMPLVSGNLSTYPFVEAEVQIISLGDPDLNWQFNTTWENETDGEICVPSTLLNYSSYRFDGVMSYVAEDYVQEFWYVDNGILSLGEPKLNEYTDRNITLRDLSLDDSTTFLFKYYDENYLTHPEAIVTVLRKYIGVGVFKEVERCKLDDNGECHFHLVEEDVIYQFRVVDEGELEYLSGEYNAKCVVTPCSITLQKGVTTGEWDAEHDNLAEGTYSISSDVDTRTVTLAFNLEQTGTMQLDVFVYSNVINSPDTLVVSDTAIAKTGEIEVLVPLSYGNQTYYAVVRHNEGFVTSVWIDMNEKGYNYFGNLGLFLGALLVLTLGLIAVSSGAWTVGFLILGMLIAGITGLIEMPIYLIMWVVSAGGLIIWKLSTRRSI